MNVSSSQRSVVILLFIFQHENNIVLNLITVIFTLYLVAPFEELNVRFTTVPLGHYLISNNDFQGTVVNQCTPYNI